MYHLLHSYPVRCPDYDVAPIKRVTVLVPDSLHRQLKFLAVDKDTTMQQIFLDAVKLYLQQTADLGTHQTD